MKELTDIQCFYLIVIDRWRNSEPVSYKFVENFSMSLKIDSLVWEEILKQLIDKQLLEEGTTGYSLTAKATEFLKLIDPKALFVNDPVFRAIPVVSTVLG